MPRNVVVLIWALFCSIGARSLIINKLRGQLLNHEPHLKNGSLSDTGTAPVTIASHLRGTLHNVSAEETVEAAEYCGCNSNTSICSVDTFKVEHELENDLVLLLGCSLDINAVDYFCKAVGAPVLNFETRNPFSYLAHCNVGKFTVAYIFHPGASPAPYFSEYAGTATTFDVVRNSVHDVQLQFGKLPTAIVVDSSLWDVSNWWQKNGRPQDPYPVPTSEINQWCHRDVPGLLRWVKTNYPTSGVAFRTPPTVFHQNGYGQNPFIVDAMVKCIEEQKDPLSRLYGRYGFIDYHNFVDQVLQHSAGPPMKTWYKDSLHPGADLSLMYMNRVLNWVRGLKAV